MTHIDRKKRLLASVAGGVALFAILILVLIIIARRSPFPKDADAYDAFIVGSSSYMFGADELREFAGEDVCNLSPYADNVSAAKYAAQTLRASRLILVLSLCDADGNKEPYSEPDTALDFESTADPAAYNAAHGADFTRSDASLSLPDISRLTDEVSAIRDICEKSKTELTVILAPAYIGNWERYDKSDLRNFYSSLADVTDFWDFSLSDFSFDSRYFYDATRPRRALGKIALARISRVTDTYIPDNFGSLVTSRNVTAHEDELFSTAEPDISDYTVAVPILMFHHFADEDNGGTIMTPEKFEGFISAMTSAGYSAVTLSDMIDYVERGEALPQNPVCVTIDDGYMSGYETAYPILKKYGMRAVIFPIGVSVGRDTYKYTDTPIIPHFGWEEAREMIASGTFEIGSHTYDMHQAEQYETSENPRTSVLPLPGEGAADYERAVLADLELYDSIRSRELGDGFSALAYPGGYFSSESERIIHTYGIPVTVTTREDGKNVLVKGLPSSLYALFRYNVTSAMTPDDLLSLLKERS